MITVTLILVALIAVLAIVGGVVMMFDDCLFTRFAGYNGIKAGFDIFAKVIPALLAILTSNES